MNYRKPSNPKIADISSKNSGNNEFCACCGKEIDFLIYDKESYAYKKYRYVGKSRKKVYACSYKCLNKI